MRQVMDSVVKQQRAMIHDALKKREPQITEQDLARIDQYAADTVKDMPVDDLLNDMIPVYQKHLSRADVGCAVRIECAALKQRGHHHGDQHR